MDGYYQTAEEIDVALHPAQGSPEGTIIKIIPPS
jgi:hypothetical protein